MSRGPAILATAVALALVNIGLAATIVSLLRSANAVPLWVGLILVAIGVVALITAVNLWRQYLSGVRKP